MAITNFDNPVTPFWRCSTLRNSRHSYGDIPIKENHKFAKNPTNLNWFCKAECLTRKCTWDFVDYCRFLKDLDGLLKFSLLFFRAGWKILDCRKSDPQGLSAPFFLLIIETSQALENLEEIVTTPGLDGVYVGTVDLSISMGLAGLGDLNDKKLQNALNIIMKQINKHDCIAGIHASIPESAEKLSEQGFRLITPVNDTNLLRGAAINALEETRKWIG